MRIVFSMQEVVDIMKQAAKARMYNKDIEVKRTDLVLNGEVIHWSGIEVEVIFGTPRETER